MKDITRRNFMKGVAGTVAGITVLGKLPTISNTISNVIKEKKINDVYDEAHNENNLRTDIYGMIKQSNLNILYSPHPKFTAIIHDNTFNRWADVLDIPIKNLEIIKDMLKEDAYSVGGYIRFRA